MKTTCHCREDRREEGDWRGQYGGRIWPSQQVECMKLLHRLSATSKIGTDTPNGSSLSLLSELQGVIPVSLCQWDRKRRHLFLRTGKTMELREVIMWKTVHPEWWKMGEDHQIPTGTSHGPCSLEVFHSQPQEELNSIAYPCGIDCTTGSLRLLHA